MLDSKLTQMEMLKRTKKKQFAFIYKRIWFHWLFHNFSIWFLHHYLNTHIYNSLCSAVKFLREVTPYFRKASIISEVGWELQRAFLCPLSTTSTIINPNGSNMLSTSSKSVSPPSAPKSPPRADTRYIPLQLTHLARNLKYHDPGTYCCCYW